MIDLNNWHRTLHQVTGVMEAFAEMFEQNFK
jgi:hypothetical protein